MQEVARQRRCFQAFSRIPGGSLRLSGIAVIVPFEVPRALLAVSAAIAARNHGELMTDRPAPSLVVTRSSRFEPE